MDYQHLRLSVQGTLGLIELDYDGKSANVLSQAMIAELSSAIAACEAMPELAGVIIASAKPSGFVFGADITEFESLSSADEVRALQMRSMRLLEQIETSHLVSVAKLHGPVLGGGLELALACDYRIAQEGARIMAGFPEANLGLMPGFAGTARARRLIGLEASLTLCLSAKPVTNAKKLHEMGMIDTLGTKGAGDDDFVDDAVALISQGKRVFAAHDAGDKDIIIAKAEAQYLAGRKHEHIPHLVAILSHFAENGGDFAALVAGELTHFPDLMMGDVSAGLRRVFALTDMVKKQARGKSDIKTIKVIGAGAMGADIATHLCLKGFTVYLSDVNEAALASAYQKADAYFMRKLDSDNAASALSRFLCQSAGDDNHLIDLVIEAVPEKLSLKQQIWAEIEPQMRADCLLATNSSALDLDEISQMMAEPSRLMGLHFFNPATIMPLVEVIERPCHDKGQIAPLMQVATASGKLPVAVQNSPGFLVNRALLPYIFEAIAAMLDGVPADEIDEALLGFGMPMGPIELADQIGLDVCFDVGARIAMPESVKKYLNEKITSGTLGRKTGHGIYQWDEKKARRERADYAPENAQILTTRLLAPLFAQCRACLAEGHIASADLVDAAMIYGIGFPRHTGGPLFYADKNK